MLSPLAGIGGGPGMRLDMLAACIPFVARKDPDRNMEEAELNKRRKEVGKLTITRVERYSFNDSRLIVFFFFLMMEAFVAAVVPFG